jgi:hypothetical protein
MANLTLVYGMRLVPADDVLSIGAALIEMKQGRRTSVTMQVLEGTKEDIEKQVRQSIEAFFDLYPEI